MSSHTQPLLNGEQADNGCIPEGDLAIRVQNIVNDGAHDAPSPKNSEEMEQYHQHYSDRAPWLRAAVLGANDGLVSVASIMLGVSGGSQDKHTLLLSGLSALVAGNTSLIPSQHALRLLPSRVYLIRPGKAALYLDRAPHE